MCVLIHARTRVTVDSAHWYVHVAICGKGHDGKVTILRNELLETGRTVHNRKPDVIIRDNNKGSCVLIMWQFEDDRNVTKNEAQKIPKYKDLNNRITAHVECENKNGTRNKWGERNHLKITQTIPEQQDTAHILGKC